MIGDILSGVGSIVGGWLGYKGQQEANEANSAEAARNRDFQADQARKQMDYQTEMSNTSYQRAVTDLQKAGLNPMLAVSKGGASTPSGAAGSGSQAAPMQNAIGAGVNGALQGMSLATAAAQLEKTNAETAAVRAQTLRTVAETVPEGHTARMSVELESKAHQAAQFAEQEVRGKMYSNLRVREEIDSYLERFGGLNGWQRERAADRAVMLLNESRESQTRSSTRITDADLARAKAYRDFYSSPVGRASPYLEVGTDLLSGVSNAKRAFGKRTSTTRHESMDSTGRGNSSITHREER